MNPLFGHGSGIMLLGMGWMVLGGALLAVLLVALGYLLARDRAGR